MAACRWHVWEETDHYILNGVARLKLSESVEIEIRGSIYSNCYWATLRTKSQQIKLGSINVGRSFPTAATRRKCAKELLTVLKPLSEAYLNLKATVKN